MSVTAICSSICHATGAERCADCSDLPGEQPRRLPRTSRTRRTKEHPMNAMATTTHPAEPRPRRVQLATGPTAPAEARTHVRTAIRNWEVPVDPYVAALLTSELVTNAIRHETGETVTLAIS